MSLGCFIANKFNSKGRYWLHVLLLEELATFHCAPFVVREQHVVSGCCLRFVLTIFHCFRV